MIGADPTTCFGGGIPGLMPGNLNTKHVVWNSPLSTRRRDPYVIMQKEHPSDLYTELTNQKPIQLIGYSDIFDIAITKNLSFPLYLTSCSALSSETSRLSLTLLVLHPFTTHRIVMTSRSTLTGPSTKLTWMIQFPSIRNCTTRWQLTSKLKTSPELF